MMHRNGWLLLAALAGGCGGSDDKGADDADSGLPPLDLTTPEGKKALRARLLDAADDHTFKAPPETTDADCSVTLKPKGKSDADNLIEAVESSDSWDVICLSPGTYTMNKSIVISAASNLTIKGIGKAITDVVLDFKGHEGDKGFDVTTPGFWIENMAVKNTIGNGVEVKADGSADNPTVFRKLKVGWDVAKDAKVDCGEEDPRRNHGAYSVYPTKSSYVVVEFCEVEGASDAGLYVGQVEHGMVRHNSVHGNVAGLEVENSFDVVVYDNEAFDNSGGILALQEPGLTRLTNDKVLIRDNKVHDNNGCNFAKPNATVASIPLGTGMMSFAGRNIEFRDNVVSNNSTTGLLIVSNVLLSLLGGKEPDFKANYDPYAHDVAINGNTFKNNATASPPGDAGFVGGVAGGFMDVSWDGFRADGVKSAAAAKICLGDSKATFVDITQDKCEMPKDTDEFLACVMDNHSNDTKAHTCKGSVEVEGF